MLEIKKRLGGTQFAGCSGRYLPVIQIGQQLPGARCELLLSRRAGQGDGARLRNDGIPTFGTSGVFVVHGEIRFHGRDERVLTKSLYEGQEYLFRFYFIGKLISEIRTTRRPSEGWDPVLTQTD